MVVATHGGTDPSVPFFRLTHSPPPNPPSHSAGMCVLCVCFRLGLAAVQGVDSQAFLALTLQC